MSISDDIDRDLRNLWWTFPLGAAVGTLMGITVLGALWLGLTLFLGE